METKENRKISAAEIKRLAASKSVPANSDRDASARLPYTNKSRTGVLLAYKHQGKNTPKNSVAHSYCVL